MWSEIELDAGKMSRMAVFSDEMWDQIEAVSPPVKGAMGRPNWGLQHGRVTG